MTNTQQIIVIGITRIGKGMSVFSNSLCRAFGKPLRGFKVIEKQLEPAVVNGYYG